MKESTSTLKQLFKDHAADDRGFQQRSEAMDAEIKTSLKNQEERFDRHLEIYAQNGKELSALKTTVTQLSEKINSMDTKMDTRFVTKDQFWPVKTLVYGVVGMMLVGIMGVIISIALVHPSSKNDIKQAVSEALQAQAVVTAQ